MHLQRFNETQLMLINVTDARIAARPLHLVPRHLAISCAMIRSHGGADPYAQSLQFMGRCLGPLDDHPSGWHTTSLSNPLLLNNACKAFHHCAACSINYPTLLLREPRKSSRPHNDSLVLQSKYWKLAERCIRRTGSDING